MAERDGLGYLWADDDWIYVCDFCGDEKHLKADCPLRDLPSRAAQRRAANRDRIPRSGRVYHPQGMNRGGAARLARERARAAADQLYQYSKLMHEQEEKEAALHRETNLRLASSARDDETARNARRRANKRLARLAYTPPRRVLSPMRKKRVRRESRERHHRSYSARPGIPFFFLNIIHHIYIFII